MAACTLSYDEIIKKYPYNQQIVMMSASGSAITNTAIGYITELQRLGSSSNVPLVRDFRFLTSIDDLKNNSIYIDKIEFEGYDTIIEGGTGQDADNYTAIIASKTATKAFAQSGYLYGMMPVNHQPNAFRPSIYINGIKFFANIANPFTGSASIIADLTIGYPLTYCFNINQEFDRLDSMAISSAYAQYISTSASVETKWVNYPLIARATIRSKVG
jgi:hypothetical protein